MYTLVITILIVFLYSLSWAYTPPKGIPNPSGSSYFTSTFGEIDQATPAWPAQWTSPSSAVANKFYVDGTQTEICSDSTNGHPDAPRCTIPDAPYTAGAYIYVHAGTYGNLQIHGSGTAASPIWITGNQITKPTITGTWSVSKSWGDTNFVIIEYFHFNAGGSLDVWPYNTQKAEHLLIRYNEFDKEGATATGDPNGITIGPDSTYPGTTTSNIVVFGNKIHDLGLLYGQGPPDDLPPGCTEWADNCTGSGTPAACCTGPGEGATCCPNKGSDNAGVYVQFADGVWVLNNEIYKIGGDHIAGCHQCDTDTYPRNIYIGKNVLGASSGDSGGENCIDFKGVRGFVISENECWGPFTREQGWGIVIHNAQTANCSKADNGWIIFNKLHHLSAGIAYVSGDNNNMYVVGNLIYDIHNSYSPTAWQTEGYNGYCVSPAGTTGNMWIVDNTFYDYDGGIRNFSALSGSDNLKAHGNIFSSRADATRYDFHIGVDGGNQSRTSIDYSQFYKDSAENLRLYWDASTITSLSNFKAGTGSPCANCPAEGNPLFVSTSSSNENFLKLQSGSPSVGASVEGPVGGTVYDLFYSTWSIAIEKDYSGTARPQGGTWDIGAYEYQAPTITKAPFIIQ